MWPQRRLASFAVFRWTHPQFQGQTGTRTTGASLCWVGHPCWRLLEKGWSFRGLHRFWSTHQPLSSNIASEVAQNPKRKTIQKRKALGENCLRRLRALRVRDPTWEKYDDAVNAFLAYCRRRRLFLGNQRCSPVFVFHWPLWGRRT